tara:strand:- start:6 stop:440 length:435 start_codon:yes stop_codon:yes gene_type:complete
LDFTLLVILDTLLCYTLKKYFRENITISANKTVSAQIIVIAWPPTSLKAFSDVFIPIAAIAVIKHQPEKSNRDAFKKSGKSGNDPIGISAKNTIAKKGMGSRELSSDVPCFRNKTVSVITIGTSNATLTILTITAVSPAVSEML